MERDYYKDLFFIDFFKTLWQIIRSPSHFFMKVKKEDLSTFAKPGTYVILGYSFMAALLLWTGNFTSQATWASINYNLLTESQKIEFLNEFNINEELLLSDLYALSEINRPGMSPISRKISNVVGSFKLKDIADYFRKTDRPEISTALYKSYSEYQEKEQKNDFINTAVVPLFLIVFAFIFDRIANNKKEVTWKVSRIALSYYSGTILFITALIIGGFSLILESNNINTLGWLFILAIPIIIGSYYLLYSLGKHVYTASFWRSFFAFSFAGWIIQILSLSVNYIININ